MFETTPGGASGTGRCLKVSVEGLSGCTSSGDTIPNCLGELGEIRERTGIAADGLRQARLEPLALSVSGRERMFNGWAAASGEKRIDFSA